MLENKRIKNYVLYQDEDMVEPDREMSVGTVYMLIQAEFKKLLENHDADLQNFVHHRAHMHYRVGMTFGSAMEKMQRNWSVHFKSPGFKAALDELRAFIHENFSRQYMVDIQFNKTIKGDSLADNVMLFIREREDGE